jgi:heterodisulfide reductase subunit A-like polyferredoxin
VPKGTHILTMVIVAVVVAVGYDQYKARKG